MEFIFYKTNDNHNVINKTLLNSKSIQLYLKSDFDLIQPNIRLVDSDDFILRNYNYCEIVELGRKYFISSITKINGGVNVVELVCDVLETYKYNILNSDCEYMRELKEGDYLDINIDQSLETNSTIHDFPETLVEGETSIIMTTIGG